jgi:ribosomal protein L2
MTIDAAVSRQGQEVYYSGLRVTVVAVTRKRVTVRLSSGMIRHVHPRFLSDP